MYILYKEGKSCKCDFSQLEQMALGGWSRTKDAPKADAPKADAKSVKSATNKITSK